jgi:cytochrome c6
MKKLIVSCLALLVTGALSVHAADAKATFQHECAKCHGRDGKGHTPMGRILHLKDFTNPKVQKAMKDEDMAKIIKNGAKDKATGRERMKAFGGSLNDQQIKELVAYVRSLGKK